MLPPPPALPNAPRRGNLKPGGPATIGPLCGGLDQPFPDPLYVGRGTALVVTGWCTHARQPIARLELLWRGRPMPPDLFGFAHEAAPHGGFAAIIPIPALDDPTTATLGLRARLSNGATVEAPLARVQLRPGCRFDAPEPLTPGRPVPRSRVAVCMATFNPPLRLFARQVQTLRNQTFRDWVCLACDDHSRPDHFAAIQTVIGDDPRFHVYRQPANRGYYHNFEHCLALVPKSVDFVALADQDDDWRPDKLASLLGAIRPRTTLAFSDMRIADAEGAVLSPTYWTTRRVNHTDLASLLLANAVTGAASLFRRELLDRVLPFPLPFGAAFHDHWLAVTALASGDLAYVDRPLYDYVQHDGNVIGRIAPRPLPAWVRAWRWLKWCWPPKVPGNVRRDLANGRRYYFEQLLRVRQLAHALALRCGGVLTPERRHAVARVRSLPADWSDALWLWVRPFRHPNGISDTAGMEYHLLNALLWKAWVRSRHRAGANDGRTPNLETWPEAAAA